MSYRLRCHNKKLTTCEPAILVFGASILFSVTSLGVYPQLKKVAKFPVYMLIEPVSACNLRCVMCFQIDKTFTKKPYMGTMSLETFKKVVDEAVAGGTKAITMASRGEPLMHKKLPEMLEYAKGKFFEIKLNTNGTID